MPMSWPAAPCSIRRRCGSHDRAGADLGGCWAAAFAKPSKLWRPAPNWKLHEWTLLNVALGRIKDSVKSFDMAAFDLHQHLVTGQMKSALRHLYGTKESRVLLRPKFWQPVKIRRGPSPGRAHVEGDIDGALPLGEETSKICPLSGGTWIFFVRTADLDKHYPVAPAGRQPDLVQPPQPPDLAPSQQPDLVQPPLRRRGPATRHDWSHLRRNCSPLHRSQDRRRASAAEDSRSPTRFSNGLKIRT